jgi:hypothetical protein
MRVGSWFLLPSEDAAKGSVLSTVKEVNEDKSCLDGIKGGSQNSSASTGSKKGNEFKERGG